MKVTRTSWTILTIGILVITFGSLGITRSQRLDEGKKLSDELAVAQLRLSNLDLKELSSKQEKLQTQINEIERHLPTDQAMLAQPNDSIFISDAVFQIAGISGVEVTQTSSAALTSGNLDKLGVLVLPFEAMVSGDLPNLIDFVTRLNIDFPTGKINLGEISMPRATDNATGNVTAGSRASARVQLVIYSYRGS